MNRVLVNIDWFVLSMVCKFLRNTRAGEASPFGLTGGRSPGWEWQWRIPSEFGFRATAARLGPVPGPPGICPGFGPELFHIKYRFNTSSKKDLNFSDGSNSFKPIFRALLDCLGQAGSECPTVRQAGFLLYSCQPWGAPMRIGSGVPCDSVPWPLSRASRCAFCAYRSCAATTSLSVRTPLAWLHRWYSNCRFASSSPPTARGVM